MAEPSGPLNGQGRVVEGLVMTDGTVGFRRGRNPVAVSGATNKAADQAMAWPPSVRISQTPTVSTTPAYTAKDAVGGLLTFAGAVREAGSSGVLMGVTVIDASQQRPSLELVLFDRTFTASTDNAIFDPSDADLANCIGVVGINSWADFNDNSVAQVSGVSLPLVLNGTSLFGQLLTRGTPTFVATSDITVIVTILQD
jgi:hypothetical protein